MKKNICLLLSILSFSIYAQTPSMVENSQPGQWQFSLQVEQDGKIIHQNEVKKCVTSEELNVNKSQNLEQFIQETKIGCTTKDFKTTSDTTSISLVCKPKQSSDTSQHINIEATYLSHAQDNMLIINSEMEINFHSSKITSKIEGKRLGRCQ